MNPLTNSLYPPPHPNYCVPLSILSGVYPRSRRMGIAQHAVGWGRGGVLFPPHPDLEHLGLCGFAVGCGCGDEESTQVQDSYNYL